MFKRKTIFSRLFLSYSFIIVTSLLLFIGVFFYLFHVNLYKEYEIYIQSSLCSTRRTTAKPE